MRTFIKIILSVVVIIITMIVSGLMAQASGQPAPTGIGIVSIIVLFTLVGIWKYKPKKNNSTDLDKTI